MSAEPMVEILDVHKHFGHTKVLNGISMEVPQGSVIETDPEPGVERRPGTAIDLVVSRGQEIPVPGVVGEAEGTAIQRLTEAGFFTDRLTLQSSTNVCLTDQGVRVQFQPYEVAPHALGYPSVEFPFDAVRQSFDRTRAQDLFDAPAK